VAFSNHENPRSLHQAICEFHRKEFALSIKDEPLLLSVLSD
jgi:hypothetical protein